MPFFPRCDLGNGWDSSQAEDPQVAWHQEAAMGPTNLSLVLVKIPQGNLTCPHQRLCPQGIVSMISSSLFPFDPAWGHNAMLSGSIRLWIVTHEGWATWYAPKSCIWLRVILPSRTRCWTPTPVTEVTRILNLIGVAWQQEPQELKSGQHPLPGAGEGNIQEYCAVSVFQGCSCLRGLSHTWFHPGVSKVRAPRYSVGESTFPFYISCDSYWDGMDSIKK